MKKKFSKFLGVGLALVLALSFSLVTAVPVVASPGIDIDGTLAPGEWDGAASFGLDPSKGGVSVYTAYVTNDDDFMYVAFDYAVTTGSDFASFNVYKQGAFTPDVINAPNAVPLGDWDEVIDGVPGQRFETERLWDTVTDDTPTDGAFTFAEWDRHDGTGRFVSAVNTATEMKVPLAELGFAPRDSIKMIFVLNLHQVDTHVYPVGASSIDPNTYATYSARVKNENTGFYYQTIQAAINTASPNDTISAGAGTYYEYIRIDKPLTVRSTDGAEETIIDGIAFRYMVDICSSNVTFEGFTVTNPTYASGSDATGILIQSTVAMSNVQILNNIVTQVRSETGTPSAYGATGINIGKGPLSNVVVSGNKIENIKNPDGASIDHTCGINVWDGAEGVEISNNMISDIKYNGILLQRASNVLIENNPIIAGCQTGIRVEPFDEGAVSNVTVNLNNFADNLIQVLDDAEVLDIQGVLDTNDFDRAVVVDHDGASLLHTIWSSIQDAIDEALSDDTIKVAAGKYEEGELCLAVPLTVQGAGKSNTIIDASGCGRGFDIGSDNVTIKGLTVQNALRNIVWWQVTVSGTRIEGVVTTGAGESGIEVHQSTVTNVLVKGCDFIDNAEWGLRFDSGAVVNGFTVEGCTFDGHLYAGIGPAGGVDGLTIKGCHFTNSWCGMELSLTNYLKNISIKTSTFVAGKTQFSWKGFDRIGIYAWVETPGLVIENIQVHHCSFVDYLADTDAAVVFDAYVGGYEDFDIDATNNWWGHASGPADAARFTESGYEAYGDAVSTKVDYEPWLLELGGETFNKTLALKDGWTLVSTNKAIDGTTSKWAGTGITAVKFAFDEDANGLVWSTAVTVADLKPVDVLCIKTDGGGGVGINYADSQAGVSSKNLFAGWNLISSGTEETAAYDVLSPLPFAEIGGAQAVGLTTLVSQGDYNQFSGSFYQATLQTNDWAKLESIILVPYDGYWIQMNAASDFGVITD